MKTFTTLFTKLFSVIICTFTLISARAQDLTASAGNAYAESKRLSAESDQYADQAARLRENARYVSGSGHDMMIEEAEAMEKLAMNKNADSQKIEYNEHMRQYEANERKLAALEKYKDGSRNASQIKFLSERYVKNHKIAEDLFREGVSQNALALRIGNFQNANESMSEAIRQQKDLIQLLKNEAMARK